MINNGFFSDFFELRQGCRQGDPLCPYIFILAIEPLAKEIKENKLIKGIKTRGSLAKKKIMFLHSKNKASRKGYKGER